MNFQQIFLQLLFDFYPILITKVLPLIPHQAKQTASVVVRNAGSYICTIANQEAIGENNKREGGKK